MIVLPPVEINEALLTSSTVPEPYAAATAWASGTAYAVGAVCYRATTDTWRQYRCTNAVASATPPELAPGHWQDIGPHEVPWNAGTSYTIGQQVIRTTTHRRYRCAIAGVNAGLPEDTPDRWQRLGPTNKWALFDQERNLPTVSLAPIVISIAPGERIDSVALLGLEAKTATVEMAVAGSVVYSRTKQQQARITKSWFEYFFNPFEYAPTLLLTDLPPYSGATITITVENGTLPARISGALLGNKIYLGRVLHNAISDSLNFSQVGRDAFGNSVLRPVRTVPVTRQTMVLEKGFVNTVRKARKDLDARAALWSWLDDRTEDGYFDAGLIYGIYKQFSIDLAHPEHAIVNIEAEEI